MSFYLNKVREFINQERCLALALCFILLFNALLIFAQKVPECEDNYVLKKIFEFRSLRNQDIYEANSGDYEKVPWEKMLLENRGSLVALFNIVGFFAFLIFGLGLFLDMHILAAKLKQKELISAVSSHLQIDWQLRDVFKLAVAFVFFGYILFILESLFLPDVAKEERALAFIPLFNTGIMDLLILGLIIYLVKAKYRQGIEALGLKLKGLGKALWLGLVSYIAFLPILAVILVFLMLAADLSRYEPAQHAVFKLFLFEKSIWFLLFATVMAVILGPIVEEVFFRGFAYNALKKRWGAQKAAVLTAVVFAGLHANILGFFPILALGLLLAYMYERSGSLISSIAIHMAHNFLLLLLLFMSRYLFKVVQA